MNFKWILFILNVVFNYMDYLQNSKMTMGIGYFCVWLNFYWYYHPYQFKTFFDLVMILELNQFENLLKFSC